MNSPSGLWCRRRSRYVSCEPVNIHTTDTKRRASQEKKKVAEGEIYDWDACFEELAKANGMESRCRRCMKGFVVQMWILKET